MFLLLLLSSKYSLLCVLVEQAVVLCQVEKSKEDMLNQLYSSVRLVLFGIWIYTIL